jgi:hypothetical protein
VVSGTVAALLASSITKFVLEERLNTHEGFVQSLVIGGSALSAILMKKTWQKLSFGAVTAGTIFILLVNKSRRR